MKQRVIKSLHKDLGLLIEALDPREQLNIQTLKDLSDHTIKDVAYYRNLDAISLAVLIYSLYKTILCVDDQNYKKLLGYLRNAQKSLSTQNFGSYNNNLKRCFDVISKCNTNVKSHVRDVFYAAKLKKGESLLSRGLSISRAADLMGLSSWDLQEYSSKNPSVSEHTESRKASERLADAKQAFNTDSHKSLFFDAGPIITLALSRMLFILEPLRKEFGGDFFITPAVREELVGRPLSMNRFKFEALQVLRLLREGTLKVYEGKISQSLCKRITSSANRSFYRDGKALEIVQLGEVETIVAAKEHGSPVVIDERTIRMLIEKSESLKSLLERRSQKEVSERKETIAEFAKQVGEVTILRSIELALVAYQKGFFKEYLPKGEVRGADKVLLDAILWNAKYNGSAVTEHEIEELKQSVR